MIETRTIKSKKGITLIELLIVIVVVAILAAIAIPLYTGYTQRARRADAKTALEQLRAAQEMWRAENGSYSVSVAELQNTMGAPATSISNYYNWSYTVINPNSFTARAQPLGSQATDGWLEINQNGVKTDELGFIYPNPQCKWTK